MSQSVQRIELTHLVKLKEHWSFFKFFYEHFRHDTQRKRDLEKLKQLETISLDSFSNVPILKYYSGIKKMNCEGKYSP